MYVIWQDDVGRGMHEVWSNTLCTCVYRPTGEVQQYQLIGHAGSIVVMFLL